MSENLAYLLRFMSRAIEGRLLLCAALLAGGVWLFVEIHDEAQEQETQAFDRRLLLALRSPGDLNDPIGPRWLEEMGRDVTALGGVGIVTMMVGACLIYLILVGRRKTALFLLACVLGGLVVTWMLKLGFDRARPDLVPHASIVSSPSFPSGHSSLATVTYLTLAGLMARSHSGWAIKVYLIVWAIVISVLVGISRVYLGVHWPTDVLAGWTVGALWALLCWTVALVLHRRGKIS